MASILGVRQQKATRLVAQPLAVALAAYIASWDYKTHMWEMWAVALSDGIRAPVLGVLGHKRFHLHLVISRWQHVLHNQC